MINSSIRKLKRSNHTLCVCTALWLGSERGRGGTEEEAGWSSSPIHCEPSLGYSCPIGRICGERGRESVRKSMRWKKGGGARACENRLTHLNQWRKATTEADSWSKGFSQFPVSCGKKKSAAFAGSSWRVVALSCVRSSFLPPSLPQPIGVTPETGKCRRRRVKGWKDDRWRDCMWGRLSCFRACRRTRAHADRWNQVGPVGMEMDAKCLLVP